ncbi:TolC family protein [Roseovarius sp.]|uniref:TolC family protein n=1 Tax=Roseovarius sp. TaxID=1486281 RepID=UPI003BADB0F4
MIQGTGNWFDRTRITVCLGTVLFIACLATTSVAQTLSQAVMIGSKRDPSIAALRQQVARETSNVEISKDARRPQLSVAGDTGLDGDNLGVNVTISQLLADWGLSKSRIAEAEAVRVKVVADLKSEVESFTLRMSELYFEIDAARRRIARTREYVAFAKRLDGYSRARVQAGLANASEVARARLEIARAEEQLYQHEIDREIARAELEFLLGQSAGQVAPPPRLSFLSQLSSSRNVIAAVVGAPDYISATADVAIAEAGVKAARAARKPTIRLQAELRQDLTGGRGRSSSVGITAGVDLNSSSFRGREVTAAEQSLRAAQQLRTAVERDLQNEMRNYRQRLQALAQTRQSLGAQVSDARVVLEAYEGQFRAGQRDLIDLLTTGRDLYETQMEQIDVEDELNRKEYEAAEALGLLGSLLFRKRE